MCGVRILKSWQLDINLLLVKSRFWLSVWKRLFSTLLHLNLLKSVHGVRRKLNEYTSHLLKQFIRCAITYISIWTCTIRTISSHQRPLVSITKVVPKVKYVQMGTARGKCSEVDAFYRLLLRTYGYVFEQREDHARSAHGYVASKPKWQRDCRVWTWEMSFVYTRMSQMKTVKLR
jgi:hypothetical protein